MESLEILEHEYKIINNYRIKMFIKEYTQEEIDKLLVAIIELKEFNKLKEKISYFIEDWINDNNDSYLKGDIDIDLIDDARKCIIFLNSLNKPI